MFQNKILHSLQNGLLTHQAVSSCRFCIQRNIILALDFLNTPTFMLEFDCEITRFIWTLSFCSYPKIITGEDCTKSYSDCIPEEGAREIAEIGSRSICEHHLQAWYLESSSFATYPDSFLHRDARKCCLIILAWTLKSLCNSVGWGWYFFIHWNSMGCIIQCLNRELEGLWMDIILTHIRETSQWSAHHIAGDFWWALASMN